MLRKLLMRTAVLGTLLARAAWDDGDTTVSNDTNERVTTAPTEWSAPNGKPGNGKALLFQVPQEARVLWLARP